MADSDIRYTCEEDRCQSSDERGDFCRLKRIPGALYCAKHGGKPNERQLMKNYRLTKYRASLETKLGSDNIMSLREEIGITRLTLEEILNMCGTSTDLMMYQPKIVQLVQTIQKTTESCQRIEEKTNQLLSKTAILQFADELLQIITEEITDPNVRSSISNRLLVKLEALDNN